MEIDLMMMGKLSKKGSESKKVSKKEVKESTENKGDLRAEEIKKKRLEQIRAKYRK